MVMLRWLRGPQSLVWSSLLLTGLGPWSTAAAAPAYEVWASDQSNSRAGVEAPGILGSWLWIWRNTDIEDQLKTGRSARPLACDGSNQTSSGPCDLLEVFPPELAEVDAQGKRTGTTLAEAPAFGRLHGMLADPQNRYMNANIFAPKGGYVGIIDGETKEAVALFRVAGTSSGRSVHMSFWNADGSALLVANLHGKVLHRIDLTRDKTGSITDAVFNQEASLGVGKDLKVSDPPTVYLGKNAQGRSMVGRILASSSQQGFSDLTPSGSCKENGCQANSDGKDGGRPKNLIICPIVSQSNKAYITLAAGGLLVADTTKTPMEIVGEYGQNVINGAGCGGVQTGRRMWLNSGVSASPAGKDQSTFTLYTLDDRAFTRSSQSLLQPKPKVIYRDPGNTSTIGQLVGVENNQTGQRPGVTTRRDSHGMAATIDDTYVHTVDRLRNNVEVIDVRSGKRHTYDLTSKNGQGLGLGPCANASVKDDQNLPINDPAPDLIEATPDGRYLMVALRGPVPVSVNHSAQGSCPGVGVIELLDGGRSGRLVGVLRTTNRVDTSSGKAPGGHTYRGQERSDVHGAAVRTVSP
jgi:hypothetical protein